MPRRNAKRGGGETTDPVTQALDSKWAEVRPLMEAQLDPIFAAMSDALPPLDGRKVLLLPDAVLGRLPLESLPVFKGAASMGRDFSLALMYNRLSHVKEKPREEQGAGEGKGAAPGKGAGDAKGGKGGGKGGAVEEEGASFQVRGARSEGREEEGENRERRSRWGWRRVEGGYRGGRHVEGEERVCQCRIGKSVVVRGGRRGKRVRKRRAA